MIGIIDYNVGNLASVYNAFKLLGKDAQIVQDPDKFKNYDKLILPGVGAFGDAMDHLKSNAADEAIKSYAKSGKYMMGICLGMQMLFDSSEEFGYSEGLGLIDGKVIAFDKDKMNMEDHKIPHMGWNKMFCKKDKLFEGINNDPYLYFVHSYHAICEDRYTIGKTIYGYEFVSAVKNDNVYGFQPHPEKSHQNGLNILKNFILL
jgi:glutamine amidotransferase